MWMTQCPEPAAPPEWLPQRHPTPGGVGAGTLARGMVAQVWVSVFELPALAHSWWGLGVQSVAQGWTAAQSALNSPVFPSSASLRNLGLSPGGPPSPSPLAPWPVTVAAS